MSSFMSDRTPEERRFFHLQMLVYDILAVEDVGHEIGLRAARPAPEEPA